MAGTDTNPKSKLDQIYGWVMISTLVSGVFAFSVEKFTDTDKPVWQWLEGILLFILAGSVLGWIVCYFLDKGSEIVEAKAKEVDSAAMQQEKSSLEIEKLRLEVRKLRAESKKKRRPFKPPS